MTTTLGLSADLYKREGFERNQLNPKVGASWTIASTTLSLAAFRTLHRALIARQTIEPTQVAGFNQLFADDEAEGAWHYGLSLDRRLGSTTFGGASYSWRNLTLPVNTRSGSELTVAMRQRSEQVGRSYLYWTPQSRLALTVEHLFERFDREFGAIGNEAFLELRTHRLPLTVTYFATHGLSARVRASHVARRGVFLRGRPTEGDDRFWVFDGALGFRSTRPDVRIVFEVRNLLDTEFQFQGTDPGNPYLRPSRLAILRLTIGV